MQSTNYVVIQGWMCNELELKGNELLVFALIYGFSQDGVSKFHGARKYIADTFNISRPTVDKALQGLLDKQYICKEGFDDFVNPNIYWVNFEVVKKLYMGCKETLQGGCKETLLNNTNKQTKKENKTNSKELVQNFEFGKQKPKKDNLYTKCVSLVHDYTIDEELQKVLIDYLQVRLEMKDKPIYLGMWKGLLNKLDREFDASERLAVVRQSIERGYASFFPVNSYSGIKTESGSRHVPTMTAEDYKEEEKRLAELEARGVQVRF